MRAERWDQLIVWDCDTCGRTQSRTISQMRSMVPTTKLHCHGSAYRDIKGKPACSNWTTVGAVMEQVEGTKYDFTDTKSRAIPSGDR